MLNVAVADDEQDMRTQLVAFLHRYAEENQLAVKVDAFEDGRQLVESCAGGYDIILLDIDMPEMEGMTAAEKIREKDRNAVLVFITNMAQCAIRGYEVEALDFIVQPIAYDPFCMRFSRSIKRVYKRENKTICLQTENGLQIVSIKDILWLETSGHFVIWHTKNGERTIKCSLKQAQKLLPDKGFAHCNKYYFVNLEYVNEIREDTVIIDDYELELSRRQKSVFAQAVLEYMGEIR